MKALPPVRHKGGDDDDSGKLPRFEVVVGNCKICSLNATIRQNIDMMLATGWTQAHVRRHWNDLLVDDYGPEYISKVNISIHSRRHVSTKETAIQRIVQARAQQQGMDIEALEGFILTKEGVAEAIVAAGLQNIVKGITVVEPKELIAAIGMLRELESDMNGPGLDEMMRQFYAFSDAVRKIVPESMFAEITIEFERNLGTSTPAKELLKPQIIEQEEIEDAEIIEDQLEMDLN